jgi:peptidoglycan/LPS O-acetylase OafA/YrhL
MLVTGLLSIPLYRSTHLHYSILYYCPFFLAGFLLCDLYLTRGEWRTSLIWDVGNLPVALRLAHEPEHRSRPVASFDRGVISQRLSRADFLRNLQPPRHHQHRRDVLQHLPLPFHDYLWCEALDGAAPFRRQLLFYYVLQSCLILPVVMLFCGIFFVLIERPCMDREWPWKLWHQAQMLLLSRAEQPQT